MKRTKILSKILAMVLVFVILVTQTVTVFADLGAAADGKSQTQNGTDQQQTETTNVPASDVTITLPATDTDLTLQEGDPYTLDALKEWAVKGVTFSSTTTSLEGASLVVADVGGYIDGAAAGTYTVTLAVLAADGTTQLATAERKVSVAAAQTAAPASDVTIVLPTTNQNISLTEGAAYTLEELKAWAIKDVSLSSTTTSLEGVKLAVTDVGSYADNPPAGTYTVTLAALAADGTTQLATATRSVIVVAASAAGALGGAAPASEGETDTTPANTNNSVTAGDPNGLSITIQQENATEGATTKGKIYVTILNNNNAIKGGEQMTLKLPSYLSSTLTLPQGVFQNGDTAKRDNNTYDLIFAAPSSENGSLVNATITINYTLDTAIVGDDNGEKVTINMGNVSAELSVPRGDDPTPPVDPSKQAPTISKWLVDNYIADANGNKTIQDVNKPVTYRVRIDVPAGAEYDDIKINDTMTSGLASLYLQNGSPELSYRILVPNASGNSYSVLKEYNTWADQWSNLDGVGSAKIENGSSGFALTFGKLTKTIILEYKVTLKADTAAAQVELATNGFQNAAGYQLSDGTHEEVTTKSEVQLATSLFVQKKILDDGKEVNSAILGDDHKVTYHINLLSPGGASPLLPGSEVLAKDTLDSRISNISARVLVDGVENNSMVKAEVNGNVVTITQVNKISTIKVTVEITGTANIDPGDKLDNVVNDQTVTYYTPLELTLKKLGAENKTLPGATYSAVWYDAAKAKHDLGAVTTGADGTALLKFYPSGMINDQSGYVQFTETTAPDGYLLDTTPVKAVFKVQNGKAVFVSGDGLTINAEKAGIAECTVKDAVDSGKGVILFTKKDASGNAITVGGGSFALYAVDSAGKQTLCQLTKDADGVYTYPEDGSGTLDAFALAQGNGKVVLNVPYGTYKIKETGAPYGYVITAGKDTTGKVTVSSAEKSRVGYANLSNAVDYGKIRITKKDTNGSLMQDVSFTITGDTLPQGYTATAQTGTDGTVLFENLPYGNYTLTETLPTGYTGKTTELAVTIDNNGTANIAVPAAGKTAGSLNGHDLEIAWENQQLYGDLHLFKQDVEGKALDGATFQLLDAAGNAVNVTGGSGKYAYASAAGEGTTTSIVTEKSVLPLLGRTYTEITGLPYGTYTLKETAAPQSYTISAQAQSGVGVTISEKTAEAYIQNEKATGGIQFTKVDADTGAVLPGAEFALTGTDFDGKTVTGKATSDQKGVVSFTKVPYGTYTVKETKAPLGYELDEKTALTFTLNAAHPSYTAAGDKVTFANKQTLGAIQITKTDGKNNALPGVTFQLEQMSADGKTVVKAYGEQTTAAGEGGNILKWENLPHAIYRVTETKTPSGYTPSAAFTVTLPHAVGGSYTSSITYAATVKNTQKFGSISLTKVDEDAQYIRLPGAEFTISGDNLPSGYKATASTNGSGVVSFTNLPYGTYTIKETTAPAGYNLSNETRTFTIDDSKSTYAFRTDGKGDANCYWTDKVQSCSLYILKYDAATQDAPEGRTMLAGAVFQLTKKGETTPLTFRETVSGSGIYAADAAGTAQLKTNASGVLLVQGLEAGAYTVTETAAPAGYMLAQAVDVTVSGTSGAAPVEIGDTAKLASLTVYKRSKTIMGGDGQGVLLAGAQFRITSMTDGLDVDVTVTTDDTGSATVENLRFGKYLITETQAPVGYQLDSDPQIVTLNDTTAAAGVYHADATFANTPITGTLLLYKQDDTGMAMAGVSFTLTKLAADGTPTAETYTEQTQASGTATFNALPYGKYQLTEQTPAGYLPMQPKTVEIQSQGQVVTLSVINERILGSLKLYKQGPEDTSPLLAGAEFRVTGPNGFAQTVTTNNDGYALLEHLPYGTYSIVETAAPDGYVLDATAHTVDITENGVTVEYVAHNARLVGSITVSKTDENGTALDGAVFRLTKQDGTPMYLAADGSNYKVDAAGSETFTVNGTTTLSEIPAGSYQITEVSAPEGYLKFDDPWTFTINEANYTAVQQAAFVNTKISLGLVVLKRDSLTKQPLAGASFRLEKQTSGDQYAQVGTDVTTGASGRLVFAQLEAGSYRLVETVAPADHVLNETPLQFTVKSDGTIPELTLLQDKVYTAAIDNDSVTQKLLLQKASTTTGDLLSGAQYRIRGTGVDQLITTTATGSSEAFLLPAGTYTVTERTAPTGYQLDTQAHTLVVTASSITLDGAALTAVDDVYTMTLKDAPQTATMRIYKVNSDGTAQLSGAKFQLSGTDVAQTLTSATNGLTDSVTLAVGNYSMLETQAPDGYIRPLAGWSIRVVDESTISVRGASASWQVNSAGEIILTVYNVTTPGEKVVTTTNTVTRYVNTTSQSSGTSSTSTSTTASTGKASRISAKYATPGSVLRSSPGVYGEILLDDEVPLGALTATGDAEMKIVVRIGLIATLTSLILLLGISLGEDIGTVFGKRRQGRHGIG